MNDRADGVVADTGEAIQRQINRADEDGGARLTGFIREYPIAAMVIAAGLGYLLWQNCSDTAPISRGGTVVHGNRRGVT